MDLRELDWMSGSVHDVDEVNSKLVGDVRKTATRWIMNVRASGRKSASLGGMERSGMPYMN